ncbi:MAG TPA: ABC transporter permease [Chryseosolibacter sp.]
MIRNYFLVAVRNLTRNKFFSALNIFGLAVSMSICMAIIMLVADQLMYDRHISKRNRIFRVNSYAVDNNGLDRSSLDNATSPMTLRDELLENYTGIAKVVRLKRGFGNNWLSFENQNVNIPVKGYYADPEFFEVFEYQFLYGNKETALKDPHAVVLTSEAAKKLFKEENPVGQTFSVGDLGLFTVTGVLAPTQKKSHIVFEALASMATVKTLEAEGKLGKEMDDWMNFWQGWNYILLEEGKSQRDVEPVLEKIYRSKIASNPNPEIYKAKFRLQSILDITPGPLVNNAIGPSLPWVFVYFLSGLAGVIMLTSCFNFTNLSIARSLKRAKEIGVRKVTGAARWQIFTQFLSESLVVAFCALLLAFVLMIALKPLMLQLTFAKVFMWDLTINYMVILAFLGFTVVVGILAGLFPAVVLSAFEPVKVLKSLSSVKLFSRMGLRKFLLVSQFTISLVFILTVIIMYKQMQLFTNKDYGFTMENNISIRLNNTSAQSLKTELLKYTNVKNVAAASHIPASGVTYGNGFKKALEDKEWTTLDYYVVDEDYATNMEVEIISGRTFLHDHGAGNKNFVVINEQAVRALNFRSATEALGQQLVYRQDSTKKEIIGVVKDYNHNSLWSKVEPMAWLYNPTEIGLLQVRYEGTHEEASRSIEKAWAKVNPGLKSDYKEVEEEIKFFYNTVFGDIINILGFIAGLAIMISCLGLLGMATYSIETRMKEVSIRKVLGSTDQGLVLLLSKGFFKLLVIAVVIGVPLAWFVNNLWLELIAYHIQISFGIIAGGVSILLALGVVTIGSQTIRAAFANPAENLKNE